MREAYPRDRLPVGQPPGRDAELLQIHKQRRPQLLDYHAQPGVDRARFQR